MHKCQTRPIEMNLIKFLIYPNHIGRNRIVIILSSYFILKSSKDSYSNKSLHA